MLIEARVAAAFGKKGDCESTWERPLGMLAMFHFLLFLVFRSSCVHLPPILSPTPPIPTSGFVHGSLCSLTTLPLFPPLPHPRPSPLVTVSLSTETMLSFLIWMVVNRCFHFGKGISLNIYYMFTYLNVYFTSVKM